MLSYNLPAACLPGLRCIASSMLGLACMVQHMTGPARLLQASSQRGSRGSLMAPKRAEGRLHAAAAVRAEPGGHHGCGPGSPQVCGAAERPGVAAQRGGAHPGPSRVHQMTCAGSITIRCMPVLNVAGLCHYCTLQPEHSSCIGLLVMCQAGGTSGCRDRALHLAALLAALATCSWCYSSCILVPCTSHRFSCPMNTA